MKVHLALAGTLTLAAAVRKVEQNVNRSTVAVRAATAAYSEALSLARLKLEAKVHTLREEPAFQQNLKWGYGNSVSQSLSGYLEPFIADAAALFTPDCKAVARATLHHGLTLPCPLPAEVGTGVLSWRAVAGTPLLVYAAPLATLDGKTYTVVAATAIDHAWLINSTELKSHVAPLALTIAADDDPVSGLVLATDGLDASGTHLANLTSRDRLIRTLPAAWLRHPEHLSRAAFLLVGLGILLACVSALRHKRLIQTAAAASKSQGLLQRQLDSKSEDVTRLSEQITNLEATITRLNDSIQTLEGEHTEHLRLKTLALQISASRDGFVTHLSELSDIAVAMASDIAKNLVAHSTSLRQIAESWLSGMRQSNPRKFLRTLAERPTQSGCELTDQVTTLMELARSLGHGAGAVSLQAEDIKRHAGSAKNVAMFWRSLEQEQVSGEQLWLLDLMVEAQGLVNTVAHCPAVTFANDIDADVTVTHLGQAKSFWVSLLYHLLSTVLPGDDTPMAKISSRLLKRETEQFLVLSWENDQVSRRPADAQSHWSLAQRMVKPTRMRLSVLPTLSASRPVALHWPEQNTAEVMPGRSERTQSLI